MSEEEEKGNQWFGGTYRTEGNILVAPTKSAGEENGRVSLLILDKVLVSKGDDGLLLGVLEVNRIKIVDAELCFNDHGGICHRGDWKRQQDERKPKQEDKPDDEGAALKRLDPLFLNLTHFPVVSLLILAD